MVALLDDGPPRNVRRRFQRDRTMSLEGGRLTRNARRGYLHRVTLVTNPDRYLNSHARDMKALRRVLELQAARASL